ncbi:hypothetical protein Taro_042668 [Colocasia esculenta]|uniref:Uncharacterized protein n=1 Tax=Colocasia esculenta TaxID=4460 RepID=A0A843WQ67_COLES|nr:hypothetical protein [Colocasia esculenta]
MLERTYREHHIYRNIVGQHILVSGVAHLTAFSSDLHRGAAMEEPLVVHPEGEVLGVPVSAPVGVEDVRVIVGDGDHPRRQRDVDLVADVAAALVEGHDGLDLETQLGDELKEGAVGRPLVPPGLLLLDDAPPDVHHDAVHPAVLELLQVRPELLRALQLVVGVDDAQLGKQQHQTENHTEQHDQLLPRTYIAMKRNNQMKARGEAVDTNSKLVSLGED